MDEFHHVTHPTRAPFGDLDNAFGMRCFGSDENLIAIRSRSTDWDWCAKRLSAKLASRAGFEPATYWAKTSCPWPLDERDKKFRVTARLPHTWRNHQAGANGPRTSSRTRTRILAEDAGIEPAEPVRTHGLASRCITTLPTFQKLTAEVQGIEPSTATHHRRQFSRLFATPVAHTSRKWSTEPDLNRRGLLGSFAGSCLRPLGYPRVNFGAPGWNRTTAPCLQGRTSATKDTRAK